MPVLAMMDMVMLLGKPAPHVPRNSSFMAFDADDQELTVGANKRSNLTVPQLCQEDFRHSRSRMVLSPMKPKCCTAVLIVHI